MSDCSQCRVWISERREKEIKMLFLIDKFVIICYRQSTITKNRCLMAKL